MSNWNLTSNILPEENVTVDTISADGIQQRLRRIGSLWFYDNMSMYVYYIPKMWRK
jgi:hypothetical protein